MCFVVGLHEASSINELLLSNNTQGGLTTPPKGISVSGLGRVPTALTLESRAQVLITTNFFFTFPAKPYKTILQAKHDVDKCNLN